MVSAYVMGSYNYEVIEVILDIKCREHRCA